MDPDAKPRSQTAAQALGARHVENCRVVPGWEHLLDLLPKVGVHHIRGEGDRRIELEAAAERLRPGDVMTVEDYASPPAVTAVNEFCVARGFELFGLTLQGHAAIRKIRH
jgi:hypothetical protein